MKLTLQQLKVFATIARYGNLGLAANELCLSKGGCLPVAAGAGAPALYPAV